MIKINDTLWVNPKNVAACEPSSSASRWIIHTTDGKSYTAPTQQVMAFLIKAAF